MEDLIKALKMIKAECEGHSSCSECPFGSNQNECRFNDADPQYWEIVGREEVIRLLK